MCRKGTLPFYTEKRVLTLVMLVLCDCNVMLLCFQAVAMRDSMAQSLYGALFDWIILHINHATMNRRDMEESVSVSRMIQYNNDIIEMKSLSLLFHVQIHSCQAASL